MLEELFPFDYPLFLAIMTLGFTVSSLKALDRPNNMRLINL